MNNTSKQLHPIWNKLQNLESVSFTALGDSLTYGWEASFSYFDSFIAKIRAQFCGAIIVGTNAGVCGDTVLDGVRRLPALLDNPPDILLVQFGINDLYANIPIEQYGKALAAIARKAIRSNAIPVFVTSGPLLHPDDRKRIQLYYDEMKKVAKSYEAPLVDLAAYWLERSVDLNADYFDDGVHPNNHGYTIMAEGLFQFYQKLSCN